MKSLHEVREAFQVGKDALDYLNGEIGAEKISQISANIASYIHVVRTFQNITPSIRGTRYQMRYLFKSSAKHLGFNEEILSCELKPKHLEILKFMGIEIANRSGYDIMIWDKQTYSADQNTNNYTNVIDVTNENLNMLNDMLFMDLHKKYG